MHARSNPAPVCCLYPTPGKRLALEGLYLGHMLHRRPGPLVYANFIASLDGRIALADPKGVIARMPAPVLNPRDWQLYLELIAQADVVLASASYLSYRYRVATRPLRPLDETKDRWLIDWRLQQGLSSQPTWAIVTRSLALREEIARAIEPHSLYVVTTHQASKIQVNALRQAGAQVLLADDESDVRGTTLVQALRRHGFERICSIAGPRVLHTLLLDDCLDRLYLTTGLRLLGGSGYATLVEGPALAGAPAFDLEALYLDLPSASGAGQLFGVYVRGGKHPQP